jgi:hypothetical protein
VVLWELTANRRLLRGKSDFETMQAITDQDAPPPSVFCDDYPPDLERIVVRGLARTPEARYQTAQELQLALEEFAREHKLAVSAISLAALMKDLFGERRTAWLEAVVPETAPSLPVAAPPPTSTAAAAPPGAPAPAPPAALTAPRPPAFVEHAPTLEIPVLTAHQLATMPAGPLSQEPGASRAGELQAPPRRRTADLPLVVASATVAADAIASATAATDPQLPRTTLPHAAAPGRGGHLALVLVLLAGAVVCLLGGGFLLWRLGVFDAAPPAGRATPAARPAPRPHSPRATPARSAPRAPAPKTHSNRGSPHDTKGR